LFASATSTCLSSTTKVPPGSVPLAGSVLLARFITRYSAVPQPPAQVGLFGPSTQLSVPYGSARKALLSSRIVRSMPAWASSKARASPRLTPECCPSICPSSNSASPRMVMTTISTIEISKALPRWFRSSDRVGIMKAPQFLDVMPKPNRMPT
jgi:hypothetical protein